MIRVRIATGETMLGGRRLRVRAIREMREIVEAVADARKNETERYYAVHGGSVANCYGYRADTEGAVVVASDDGRATVWAGRLPANKVTRSGVAALAVEAARAIWDERYGDERAEAAMMVLDSLHAEAHASGEILEILETEDLDAIGPAGDDDRLSIRHPVVVARSPEGIVVRDALAHPSAGGPRPIVQVLVRDASTGQRHALTVPPQYGYRLWRTGELPCDRVHAAIAWTFRRSPTQYAPAIQA